MIGANCYISKYAHILTCGGNIRIGDYSTVNPLAMIYGQGGLNIGNGVRIATQTAILPSNHIFSDRDNYIFQQGLSKEGITIEDDVWIGAGVKIYDTDFHSLNKDERVGTTYKDNSVYSKEISIGNDCFIGAGTMILKGVHIGDNVVVGASSVVTRDLESNAIYAGNPARIIRYNEPKE